MSIKILNHVWEHSQQKGSYLVTMLAIADYAHDDGTRAYPSIATLAKKTRMTERNVQLVLRKLESDGEIIIHANAGPHGCNMYSIPLSRPVSTPQNEGGEKISGEQNIPASERCKTQSAVEPEITPYPSLDPSKPKKDPRISLSSTKKEKTENSPEETSSSTKSSGTAADAGQRPDDVLAAAGLSAEEYAMLAAQMREQLIAEGVKAFCLTKPVIEARMVEYLIHGGEIPLLTHEIIPADCPHPPAQVDADGRCHRCGVILDGCAAD